MVLVSITFPKKSEAKRMSKRLVEKRLAACANIYFVESMYWWKGKIVMAREAVADFKTLKRHIPLIKKVVLKYHPDAVPSMTVAPVLDTLPAYRRWVTAETSRHARR